MSQVSVLLQTTYNYQSMHQNVRSRITNVTLQCQLVNKSLRLKSIDVESKEAHGFNEFDQPISGVAGKNAIEKTNNLGQAGEIDRSYDEFTKQVLIKNLLD